MKTYTGTLAGIKTQLINDINSRFAGTPLKIKDREAKLKSVLDTIIFNKTADFSAEVEFSDGSIGIYALNIALNSRLLRLEKNAKEIAEICDFYLPMITDLIIKEQDKKYEEFAAKRKEEQEIKQLAEKNKRLEAKRLAQKESCIRSANKLSSEIVSEKIEDGFFVELGYISKHIKSIEAAMPDYLESWFVSEFGDAERRVVNSNKLTSGGYSSQWTLSMKINLDTNDNIPASLLDKLGAHTAKVRPIANTQYVFNLCKQYGFKFGKVQDLDLILSHIPVEKLDQFKLGCSLA